MPILIGTDSYGSSAGYGADSGQGITSDSDVVCSTSGQVTHLYARTGTTSVGLLPDNIVLALYDSFGNLLCYTGALTWSNDTLLGGAVNTPTSVTSGQGYRIMSYANGGYHTYLTVSGAAAWSSLYTATQYFGTVQDPLPATNGSAAAAPAFYAWEEAAALPTISSVTPSTLTAGSNPVIAGTNFEASQGTGTVKLSPTDNVADAAAVTQSITSWSDTEITLDGVSFPTGTSHNDTLYLFVTNDTGDSNAAGEAVTAYIAPTLASPTAVSIGTTTVTPRVTTDTGNGTCYYVITPQAESEPSNTQVEAGTNAADGAPVASGSQVVSAAGVITFSEVTGLTAGTAYRISYAHSGTPS